MEDLIILGAGTMAQEVTASCRNQYNVVGYGVSQGWQQGSTLYDKPIYNLEQLAQWAGKVRAVRGIFHSCLEFMREVEAMGFEFASVIDPSASVADSTTIEGGTFVNRLVAIGCHGIIGRYVLLNRGCLIGHHCRIEAGATFGPGVNIASSGRVGEDAFIGMGAIIIENITIEAGRQVRARSLIVR